jgi:hypothetical protein
MAGAAAGDGLAESAQKENPISDPSQSIGEAAVRTLTG